MDTADNSYGYLETSGSWENYHKVENYHFSVVLVLFNRQLHLSITADRLFLISPSVVTLPFLRFAIKY